MTSNGFFLRVVRRFGFLYSIGNAVLKRKIASLKSRERINKWYNHIDLDAKAVFQNTFSKIFRKGSQVIESGSWKNEFRGKEIIMPLRNEYTWLDWDNAISIMAHDPEVKKTYENLLDEDFGIQTFFDVGANYGTHSLLFLTQGINTVSFEPNHTLNEHFRLLCELNQVKGNMVNVAVGDRNTVTKLSFPPEASWLGTIVEQDASRMRESMKLETIEVPVVTLDEFVKENKLSPELIKIDTEGNEIRVLEGATGLIISKLPLIIFESNTSSSRNELWDFFKRVGYEICTLPYGRKSRHIISEPGAFLNSKAFNFIAVPAKG